MGKKPFERLVIKLDVFLATRISPQPNAISTKELSCHFFLSQPKIRELVISHFPFLFSSWKVSLDFANGPGFCCTISILPSATFATIATCPNLLQIVSENINKSFGCGFPLLGLEYWIRFLCTFSSPSANLLL